MNEAKELIRKSGLSKSLISIDDLDEAAKKVSAKTSQVLSIPTMFCIHYFCLYFRPWRLPSNSPRVSVTIKEILENESQTLKHLSSTVDSFILYFLYPAFN